MANILHSTTVPKTVTVQEPDGQGGTNAVEKVINVVKEVTFMLDKDTPHTLTFLDKGTLLKDGEGVERVVGDAETAYHEFESAEEAVQAYLDGKV